MANKHKVKRFRKEMDIYKISILLELYLWLWFLVNAVQSRGSSLQNRPLVRLPTPPPTYWCIQLWLWITAASVFTISYLHLQLLNTSQWSQACKPFVASTLLIFIYKCFTLQQPAARRDDKLLGYFICTDINKYLRNHFRILFLLAPSSGPGHFVVPRPGMYYPSCRRCRGGDMIYHSLNKYSSYELWWTKKWLIVPGQNYYQ